jgi:hypothetical protein
MKRANPRSAVLRSPLVMATQVGTQVARNTPTCGMRGSVVVPTTEVGEAQAAKYGRRPKEVFETKGVDHSFRWCLQWLSGSEGSPNSRLQEPHQDTYLFAESSAIS